MVEPEVSSASNAPQGATGAVMGSAGATVAAEVDKFSSPPPTKGNTRTSSLDGDQRSLTPLDDSPGLSQGRGRLTRSSITVSRVHSSSGVRLGVHSRVSKGGVTSGINGSGSGDCSISRPVPLSHDLPLLSDRLSLGGEGGSNTEPPQPLLDGVAGDNLGWVLRAPSFRPVASQSSTTDAGGARGMC
ncbi:unnamed protein product, partial [Discosporangium mesarthrocarpum]